MFQYIEENQSVIQQKFVDFINHDLAYSSSVSCFLQKSKSSLLALCFFSATVATISLLLTPIAHAETTTNLYKVQRGDTLLGVANKFQISAKELATENKKQITDNLLTNEILILPSTVFASAATAATNTTTAKASPAKTPTKVATTSTTKNPFYDTKQIPTDKLSITTQTTYKSISTEPYTIKSGDSLTSLAKKYKVTLSEMQKINPTLGSSTLKVGQKITVPASAVSTANAIKAPNSGSTGGSGNAIQKIANPKITIESYTVKSGDTLTSLASRYDLTVNDISKINQIMPDTVIKVGQTLMIPVTNSKTTATKKY